MSDNAYDAIQYESFPFPETHPQHLYTVGRFFGLRPHDYQSARVLELGCASGGNLIPMAHSMPEGTFVGVDLSKKQVEEGNKQIEALGLDNIELHCMSITDIDKEFGQFDYIIVHGVYSWVPEEVRMKILSVCKENLSPDGIAYVSYNTLPGWNMVKSIRDMMLYHIKVRQGGTQNKTQLARQILRFIGEGLEKDQSPYAQFLNSELNLLSRQGDSYLAHDHLEEVNHPEYFHEFASHAGRHGLRYLSDTRVASMFPQNLPPQFAAELSSFNDVLKTEQYTDFIRNRRFRSSLLVHEEQAIDRNLNPEVMKEFYLTTNLLLEEHSDADLLSSSKKVNFKSGGGVYTVTDPVAKVALKVMIDQKGKPISFPELCRRVDDWEGLEADPNRADTLHRQVGLLKLFMHGMVEITSTPYSFTTEESEKPKLSPFVAQQLKGERFFVTNERHQVVQVTPVEKLILESLDGGTSFDELHKKVTDGLSSGAYPILTNNGIDVHEREKVESFAKELCEQTIQKCAVGGLFVN